MNNKLLLQCHISKILDKAGLSGHPRLIIKDVPDNTKIINYNKVIT